jgi:predicted transposase YdaD
LWLRLLGKGQTQQRAIEEVLAFDTEDPRRSSILRLLANWKISIEVTRQIEAEEAEFLMALSQAYLEWEQATEQRGEQRGRQEGEQQGRQEEALSFVLRLLPRRVGTVPPEIEAQIRTLSLQQLEELGEALLDFSQISDLQNWLYARDIANSEPQSQ